MDNMTLHEKITFQAYIFEITCIDEDGVRFDVQTETKLPTNHCFLPNELIVSDLVVIMSDETYNFQGELYNGLEIKINKCNPVHDKETITTRLVFDERLDIKNVISEPFCIKVNNAPAYIESNCICKEPLIEGKRYKFWFRRDNNKLSIIKFKMVDIPFYPELWATMNFGYTQEEAVQYCQYDEKVRNIIGKCPMVKVKIRGYIKDVNNGSFLLVTSNGNVYQCIIIEDGNFVFKNSLCDNKFKTIYGYIAKDRFYVTNCSNAPIPKRNLRKYIKK